MWCATALPYGQSQHDERSSEVRWISFDFYGGNKRIVLLIRFVVFDRFGKRFDEFFKSDTNVIS